MVPDQDHHDGDQLSPPALFAGVDWGGSFHQLCVLDGGGTLAVAAADHPRCRRTGVAGRSPRWVRRGGVGGDRTRGGPAGGVPADPATVTVFCVSPKISARARERYRLSASKSDSFDAFVLADTLRHEYRHWRPLSRPSPLTAQLQAVSRDRQRVLHAKVACESRLRAVLETYHPAPAALVLRAGPGYHVGVHPRLSDP